MKKQFVTYEIALKLKELGFNEECFGYYTPMKKWMMEGTKFNSERHFHGPNWANSDNTMRFMYVQNSFGDRDSVVKNSGFTKAVENIATPLWQQAIDWFREEHDVIIDVAKIFNGTDSYHFAINLEWEYFSGTYYEALEESILKAIELIK